MKYFQLIVDFSAQDDVVGRNTDLKGIKKYDVLKGQEVAHWCPDITFEYDPEEGALLTDYLGNNLGWFLVSDEFKNVFEDMFARSVQFLPVNVVNKYTRKVTIYYVVNVIEVQDVLDLTKSEYTTFTAGDTEVLSVKKYALKIPENQEVKIFKLLGYEIPLFISEEVKNKINEVSFTGFSFHQVENNLI